MNDIITLLIVFCLMTIIGISIHFFKWRDSVREKRRTESLKNAGPAERACDLIRILKDPGWNWSRFKSALDLANTLDSRQDEKEMLEGLERIFQEAVKTDEIENNPPGNGRWYFYFYDSGFAAHCEALRNRLGLPQPFDKSSSESGI